MRSHCTHSALHPSCLAIACPQNEAAFIAYFQRASSLSEAVAAISSDWPSYKPVSIYARARRLSLRYDQQGQLQLSAKARQFVEAGDAASPALLHQIWRNTNSGGNTSAATVAAGDQRSKAASAAAIASSSLRSRSQPPRSRLRPARLAEAAADDSDASASSGASLSESMYDSAAAAYGSSDADLDADDAAGEESEEAAATEEPELQPGESSQPTTAHLTAGLQRSVAHADLTLFAAPLRFAPPLVTQQQLTPAPL